MCADACVLGEPRGRKAALVKDRIIFRGQSGQCELALRQDRANSESIKLAGVMHTEGRPQSLLCREGFNCSHTEWLFHWHSGNSTILSS